MNSDDHARSVHAKLFAECREENERLRAALQSLYDAAPDAKRIILTDEAAKRLYDARRNARVVLGGGNE